MGDSDDLLWLKVARVVVWAVNTALGALLLLEIAVVFRLEFVSAWESFAMFFGTLLWFGAVTLIIWEGTINSHMHKSHGAFLVFEIFWVALFLVSFLGHFYETLKMHAMILNVAVSLAFFAIFMHISAEMREERKKYRRVK